MYITIYNMIRMLQKDIWNKFAMEFDLSNIGLGER